MKIAELFIKLGVKTDDKLRNTLKDTDKGLGQVKSMAIETKAAILGAIYTLQQLTSASMKSGTGLEQFAASTGLSLEKLQRWQYAARKFGVDAGSVEASVKGVQDTMARMRLYGQTPQGLGYVASLVGFDELKAIDQKEGPWYTLKKLQEFAQKAPADVGGEILKSFGVTEEVFAAMRKNQFTEENMKGAIIYSERQAQALMKVNAQWANLGDSIEKSIGKLNAKHGGQLVKDISKLTKEFLNLIEKMAEFAETVSLFDNLAKAINTVAKAMKNLSDASKFINEAVKDGSGWNAPFELINAITGKDKNSIWWLPDSWQDGSKGDMQKKDWSKLAAPNVGPGFAAPPTQNNNVTVNQNFQHPGNNARELGNSTRQGVQQAIRQIPAAREGN